MFFRETSSKAGIVSKSYNINGTDYSHVGIGAMVDQEVVVYHILYSKSNGNTLESSELKIEKIQDFYNPANDKVVSGAIVEVKNISALNLTNFNKIVINLSNRKLTFDKKFESKEDDYFYCSELVYYIVNNSKSEIKIDPIKKKLSGIDAVLLRRDSITYYPTDIFLNNKNFQILKKW
ncbi:hypothetical protein J8J42_05575 [Chryseobacterium sp. cx-311]|uniref:hypothetical protein n=1 Tax=Marnyiella aurantia TaxID=2758037 RepID=UPI001AE66B44|nr:hypothetical protein [Marnyiella aurantia]MBP0612512.1 hypothetical protein [Marnyiella aurantia]